MFRAAGLGALAAALVGVWWALTAEDLSGGAIALRGPLASYRASEQRRWNGNVSTSFRGAVPVATVFYNTSDAEFAPALMEGYSPFVVKGSPVLSWRALRRWRDPSYLAAHLRAVKVHAPTKPAIRMHHENQPLGDLPSVNWTRPWVEHRVGLEQLARGDRLAYFMINTKKLAPQLLEDISPTSPLTLAWRQPLEINVWMGTTGVTTPAHFDMAHNFYTQVVGHKRFILFPPEDEPKLYTYTRLHPSARQSQIDFDSPEDELRTRFPLFFHTSPREVVLAPGDVLYIPPFWFHHVSVVTNPGNASENAFSVSVSVHTVADEIEMRVNMIEASLELPVEATFSFEEKICLTMFHIRALFLDDGELVATLQTVLDMSYSHWQYDREAVGLYEMIVDARSTFPTVVSLNSTCSALAAGRSVREWIRLGHVVRTSVNGAHGRAIITNMLHSYAQDTIGLVLGPLYVDPFLRWVVAMFRGATA